MSFAVLKFGLSELMHRPVHFYCHSQFRTIEIHDVTSNVELPPEPQFVKLVVFKEKPKPPLGWRGSVSQLFAKEFVGMKIV